MNNQAFERMMAACGSVVASIIFTVTVDDESREFAASVRLNADGTWELEQP